MEPYVGYMGGVAYHTLRMKLTGVGSSTVSEGSPLKSGSQESSLHLCLFEALEKSSAAL